MTNKSSEIILGYNMKQNLEKVADEIISAARERGIPVTDKDKEKIITAIQKASKIVDKLTGDVSEEKLDVLYQALAEKTDDPLYILKRNGIDIEPELEEFRQFLAEISGKKIEPAKPKYPATKKEVEEELRKAGVPEEQVKVVAPRLATAVWLDKWFENAAKSYTYKKLGGVPLDELKNLRNMILAKKHVAEVAAKVMEEHWARKDHVKIGEEHASEMFEDLENIRNAVKEGKMSVEEALLREHLEIALLLTVLKNLEELTGQPENLAFNPRPLSPDDKYVIKLEALERAYTTLKPMLRLYAG